MTITTIAQQTGLPPQLTRRILAIFGWNENDELDAEEVQKRLDEGLNEVADADGRNTGEGRRYPQLDDMSLEDATLARRMADALRRRSK